MGGWEVRYRDPDNRTLRRTFETRKQAEDFKAEIRTDKNRGDYLDPRAGNTRFRDVAEDWYAGLRPDLRPKTRMGYRSILDHHLLPHLGHRAVGKITPNVLRKFLADDLPKHLSPTTRRNVLRTLKPIFELAVEDGLIRKSPITKHVRNAVGKVRPREMLFLSPEQVADLGEETGPDYRTLIYFAAYTGMRAGEIAALRVRGLDLLKRVVTVSESLSDLWGKEAGWHGRHFGPPKNKKIRTVALPRFLVDLLMKQAAGKGPDDFVFGAANGEAIRHGNFYNRSFKPAVARLVDRGDWPDELRDLRFHDLRHTCASLLIAQGVHAKAVSEWLGHSSIVITMDRYGHLYPDHREEIADSLEESYKRALDERLDQKSRTPLPLS